MTGQRDSQEYAFSYTAEAVAHSIIEEPSHCGETVPLRIFAHASTLQALARYLVDTRRRSFTEAARLLGRSPKTIWASYHQAAPLPQVEESLPIPVEIFTRQLAPLEALVSHLRSAGLRNAEIARAIGLDPRTTATAARRAEAKR